MTEFWLFVVIGAIAVISAVMMLLSDNAVYSALFLIITMGCIAFLFLLLNAPFLAMIQITVYAGAIMVLFLFVIMLLGAERLGITPPPFNWQTPFAIALSAAFLIITGLSIIGGQVNLQSPPSGEPSVRILNAATDAGPLDVYANDTLIAAGVPFNQASDFVNLPPGDYDMSFVAEDGETFAGTFTFAPDTTQTLVAYGAEGDVTVSVVPMDLSAPDRNSARITFFNAYPYADTVQLVDLGPNGALDIDATTGRPSDRVIIEEFPPGAVSDAFVVEQGIENWAFVEPDGTVVRHIFNTSVGRSYEVERDTAQLIALTARRVLVDDSVRPSSAIIVDEAEAHFGGPEAIGDQLFTVYLLPFELVSLLLLAAMVGAIILTHKEEARVRRTAERRRVSRPLATVVASQVGREVTATPEESEPRVLPPAEGRTPAGD